MKRILLGTSALAAVAFLVPAAGAGEAPKLSVSGGLDYHIATISRSQDNGADLLADTWGRGVQISSQQYMSEIAFSAKDGLADNGLEYGAEVQWRPTQGSTGGIDEAWITLGGLWGNIKLGDEDGAFDDDVAGYYITPIGGQDAGHWGASFGPSDGPSQNGFFKTNTWAGFTGVIGETGDASKIKYTTPTLSGLSANVAFTPDSGKSFDGANTNNAGNFQNVTEIGVDYNADLDGVAVGAHGAYVIGKHDSALGTSFEDAKGWQAGAKVGFSGFTVAASYGDRGKGGCPTSSTFCDQGSYYEGGVAYAINDLTVGATVFNGTATPSEVDKKDTFTSYSVEANYKLAEGLSAYSGVMVANYETHDSAGAAQSADATSFIVGTRVSF